MNDRPMRERVIFHEALGAMEADFTGMAFTTRELVDAFYDEADRRLAETKRRWYFLVNYTDCVIADEVWDHFAARGKNTNVHYSLGTVRIGASLGTRDTIRQLAQRDMFRANIHESRDQAIAALGALRKRAEVLGEARGVGDSGPLLRIDDVHLTFGGVRALVGVGFEVEKGEIYSIIGPNGAGKSSMLNVVSGFYRPDRGRIVFEGKDRTNLPAHAVARLGFARTFQNIALFKGMSTLDNIMTGR
jgi:ABC-type multidrug transport system fused ATPase/permease subunit